MDTSVKALLRTSLKVVTAVPYDRIIKRYICLQLRGISCVREKFAVAMQKNQRTRRGNEQSTGDRVR